MARWNEVRTRDLAILFRRAESSMNLSLAEFGRMTDAAKPAFHGAMMRPRALFTPHNRLFITFSRLLSLFAHRIVPNTSSTSACKAVF
jgi:hypothetical protein